MLVETPADKSVYQEAFALPTDCVTSRLMFLEAQQVDLLVCGAVSRSSQYAIESR